MSRKQVSVKNNWNKTMKQEKGFAKVKSLKFRLKSIPKL